MIKDVVIDKLANRLHQDIREGHILFDRLDRLFELYNLRVVDAQFEDKQLIIIHHDTKTMTTILVGTKLDCYEAGIKYLIGHKARE